MLLEWRDGQAVAIPCSDTNEVWDGVAPEVCSCSDQICLEGELEKSLAGAVVGGVRGDNTAAFTRGTAVLDQLALEVSGANLRLMVFQAIQGAMAGSVRVLSDVFVVSPGQLDRLHLTVDPAEANSCPRCPPVRI